MTPAIVNKIEDFILFSTEYRLFKMSPFIVFLLSLITSSFHRSKSSFYIDENLQASHSYLQQGRQHHPLYFYTLSCYFFLFPLACLNRIAESRNYLIILPCLLLK